jgi:cell division protein FtsQ
MGTKARRRDSGGFWNRPYMMHLLADWLMIGATFALGYAAVLWLVRLPLYPLRDLVVATPLRQVAPAQVEYAARRAVTGNFFTVDLDKVRETFEKLPWVRQVQVRRVWPAGLEVSIDEHVAAAHWRQGDGEQWLVSDQGEVFSASSDADLPLLAGPESSAPEVLRRYARFREALAPLGRRPQAVSLSPRLAWQVRLDDGAVLELGRDQARSPVDERLRRFVAAHGELASRLPGVPAVVDLRYPNGFAIKPVIGRTEAKSK